jgi:predicted nucleotidyltransferase
MNEALNRDYILSQLMFHRSQLADFVVQQIGQFGSYVRNEATE